MVAMIIIIKKEAQRRTDVMTCSTAVFCALVKQNGPSTHTKMACAGVNKQRRNGLHQKDAV